MNEKLFTDQSPPPGANAGILPGLPGGGPPGGGPSSALAARPTGVRPGDDPRVLEYNEEAVSDEEQAQYTQFVNRAKEYIAKSPDIVVEQMNDKQQEAFKGVGKTALSIAKNIAETAEAAGQPIPEDVQYHGGTEIVDMLMELGDAAGIFPFKKDSKEYDEVMGMALMHGMELVGNDVLAGPNAARATEDAENFMVQGIAREQERGEVPPEFFDSMRQSVANRGKVA